MYFGLKTKKSRLLHSLYFALLVPAILSWILYITFVARCIDDIENAGTIPGFAYGWMPQMSLPELVLSGSFSWP